MNAVIVSGYTTGKVVSGEKTLRFSVVAKHGYSKNKEQNLVEFIPCCMFDPSDRMREILNQKGTFLELRGRISSSKYEKDGETKYSTEVIVDNGSINLVKMSPKPEEV